MNKLENIPDEVKDNFEIVQDNLRCLKESFQGEAPLLRLQEVLKTRFPVLDFTLTEGILSCSGIDASQKRIVSTIDEIITTCGYDMSDFGITTSKSLDGVKVSISEVLHYN